MLRRSIVERSLLWGFEKDPDDRRYLGGVMKPDDAIEFGVDCTEGFSPNNARCEGVSGMSVISSFFEMYGIIGRSASIVFAMNSTRHRRRMSGPTSCAPTNPKVEIKALNLFLSMMKL